MSFIGVEHLCKTYTVRKSQPASFFRKKSVVVALQDVSFEVEQGELVGYIGPNGAGKSTTIKILCGILTPESGTVRVGGQCPWAERRKYVRNIGVTFGQRMQLWWDVPIRDSYDLLKDIYGLEKDDYRHRLQELMDALDLAPLMETPLRMLSLGQRMRAELAGSLLHRPKILFLDEPTIGLDAVSKLTMRDFLKKENHENGTTVMLTTHDMEDIAALCPRVMVIGKGRKLYDGALKALLEKYDTMHMVAVRFEAEPVGLSLPGGCESSWEGDTLKITYKPRELPTSCLLSKLQEAGNIRELTAQPQNIDTLVATMYREMGM